MIKKVRIKFIMIAMTAIVFCTMALVVAINLVNFYEVNAEIESIISSIADNNGKFPNKLMTFINKNETPETFPEIEPRRKEFSP